MKLAISNKAPKLRFKHFSDCWEEKKLHSIAQITMGQSPDSVSYSDNENDLPLIQGKADIKNRLSFPQKRTSKPSKTCSKGSILMTVRAPVGSVAKSVHHACIGRGICSINPIINTDFVYQFLIRSEDKWRHIEQGSTFSAINKDDISDIAIYVPSLDEQAKIANFFALIDERISTQEQIIENLEQLKRGYMQKIFSQQLRFKDENCEDFPEWEEMTFDEAISRGLIKKINPSELLPFDGNKTYLSTSSIDRYGICGDDGVVEYNTKPSRASMYPYNGSVWFAKMKDSLKVYKADEEAESKYILSTGFYGFIPNPDLLDGEFLRQTFLSEYFNLQKNQYSYGTTMAALNDEGLYAIAIIVPVLNEQKKIADMLMSIDSKIDTEKQILKNLHELKKGYLQQMFI